MEYWSREEKVDAIQWTGENIGEVMRWAEDCYVDLYVKGREIYKDIDYVFFGMRHNPQGAEWALAPGEYIVVDSLAEISLLTERDFTKRYYRRPL